MQEKTWAKPRATLFYLEQEQVKLALKAIASSEGVVVVSKFELVKYTSGVKQVLEANIPNKRTRMSQLNEFVADFKKFRKTSATKHYPKDLKERTVELLNEGVPLQELIDKLNIHPTTLSPWKYGRRKKEPSFSNAIILDEKPEIKVTVVTGLYEKSEEIDFRAQLAMVL